jgi:hypothetical protein
LQTSGKISPEGAYKQIHLLWKHLKRSKKAIPVTAEYLLFHGDLQEFSR